MPRIYLPDVWSVSLKSIFPNWRPTANAKFRTWLHTVQTRQRRPECVTNGLARTASPVVIRTPNWSAANRPRNFPTGVGGAASTATRELFALEARREIFSVGPPASSRMNSSDATWQSFLDRPPGIDSIDLAAAHLATVPSGLSYAARSRVIETTRSKP